MAKVRDTETVPNLGLQTLTEFFAIPEMAAPYETPSDEDAFLFLPRRPCGRFAP